MNQNGGSDDGIERARAAQSMVADDARGRGPSSDEGWVRPTDAMARDPWVWELGNYA
jgi:hypothetical protein